MLIRNLFGMVCPVLSWAVLRLDIGGDAPSPPQPDPRIGQAAAANTEIQREYLDLAREEYEFRKARDIEMQPLFEQMVSQYIESSSKNAERADEAWDRYKTVGIPAADEYLQAAREVGTEADQARAAGRAVQDVDTQFDTADAMYRREMSRSGVAPTDGANMVGRRLALLGRAGARAGAVTRATENQRLLGLAAKEGAAKFTAGLPSQGLAADAAAINAGSAATGTIGAQAGLHAGGVNTQASLMSGAVGAGSSAGNLLLGQHQAQMQGYNAALQHDAAGMEALGSFAGSMVGMGVGSKWNFGFGKKDGGPVRLLGYARGGRVRAPRLMGYIEGGPVAGPGGPRDDAIPALIEGQQPAALSDGEYVIKAESVDRYGPRLLGNVNEGKAEIIPSDVLTEAGRNQIRGLVLALAAPAKLATGAGVRPRKLSDLSAR